LQVIQTYVAHTIRWFTFYNMTKPKHQLQKPPTYARDSTKLESVRLTVCGTLH